MIFFLTTKPYESQTFEFPIISLDSPLGNWKVLSFYEMFLSVKNLILLGGASKKKLVLLCVVCGDDHGRSHYFFSPQTFLLTLLQVERIVGKNRHPQSGGNQ